MLLNFLCLKQKIKLRHHKLSRFQRLFILVMTLYLTIYFTSSYVEQKRKNQELYDSVKYDSEEPDILNGQAYNIFFIETDPGREYFTWKDLSAIESAAFNNPNARVYVYSLTAKFNQVDLRTTYQNIKLTKLDPLLVFSGTPLMSWWQSGSVNCSQYKIAHLSDAVRLALLYKYGGFYSDTDTITLKSFSDLINYNGFGVLDENGEALGLGNGFMVFGKARHPFLQNSMSFFTESYEPNVWGHNGPTLLIRTLKQYCQFPGELKSFYRDLIVEHGAKQVWRKDRCNVNLLPEDYFYPFKYYNETKLIVSSNGLSLEWRLENTYSLHLYGLLTRSQAVKLNGNSLYDNMARQNSPVTCKYLLDHELDFQEERHFLFYFILISFLVILITCICLNLQILL